MAYIVPQIVVVLVNREISDRSVNWPRVRRRYYPFDPMMSVILSRIFTKLDLSDVRGNSFIDFFSLSRMFSRFHKDIAKRSR